MDVGEHIISAGRREISEETGASQISEFELKGVVSERLVSPDGRLVAHFLIFVGFAAIDSFKENHREGELSLFSESQLESIRHQILPSHQQ